MNKYVCYKSSYKKLKNEWRKYEYVKKKCKVRKKCKINFNKPLVSTINNLIKPLLSKPETILIQKKYETIPTTKYTNIQSNCKKHETFFGSHDTYVTTYEVDFTLLHLRIFKIMVSFSIYNEQAYN